MQKKLLVFAFIAIFISSIAVFACPASNHKVIATINKEEKDDEHGIFAWHFASTGFSCRFF